MVPFLFTEKNTSLLEDLTAVTAGVVVVFYSLHVIIFLHFLISDTKRILKQKMEKMVNLLSAQVRVAKI